MGRAGWKQGLEVLPHEGRRWAFLGEGWPCRAQAEGDLSLNRGSQELSPAWIMAVCWSGSSLVQLCASSLKPPLIYQAEYILGTV